MSEQQMDKMREEYEAWFCSTMPYKIAKESWFAVMDDGDYIITDVQAGWAGWKASCAALSENHSPDSAKMVAPEGWQLVPVEPTIEMVKAATHSAVGFGTRAAYKAMLAAAPKHEGGA